MIPYIMGTIITVDTTIVIFTLEDLRRRVGYDWRPVQHAGDRDPVLSGVLHRAERGYGSAIAIVLLVAVIPVMIYNLRQLRSRRRSDGRRNRCTTAAHECQAEDAEPASAHDIVVNGILVLLVIGWTIPVLGLLVSSFRTRFDIQTSGWWTVLPHRSG